MKQMIKLPPGAAHLIKKMENAPDFGYDDEAVALNTLLGPLGLKWKWSDNFYNPHVVVYPAIKETT